MRKIHLPVELVTELVEAEVVTVLLDMPVAEVVASKLLLVELLSVELVFASCLKEIRVLLN